MIFEDMLMIVLDALILVGYFSVPKITHTGLKASTLYMQLGSTFMSIYLAITTLSYQS
jgi:hypothetical protein